MKTSTHMSLKQRAVVLLAALIMVAGCSAGSPINKVNMETFEDNPVVKKRIAFSSNRHGNLEIYVMDPDGTHQTRLTRHQAEDDNPAWSPDGSKITFVSDRDGNREIYTMDADGSNLTNLTNHPANDFGFCWSPDNRTIVFVSTRDGHAEIYSMHADGSQPTRLTHSMNSFAPSYSYDGRKIAFMSKIDADRQDSMTLESWKE